MSFPFFPTAASTTATQVDHLYFFLLGLSVFVLAIVFLPMIYFLFKYRRGKKADRKPLETSTLKIELTWTLIPLFIAMGLFAWGADVYFYQEVPPAGTLDINVVGKQWMWKIQHQEGNREINELHIPINRDVKLTLASEDVIHSFFIPAFRVKQDVVPGRFTTEWFRATRTGAYRFYCSEYCGADHAKMRGMVYVMTPAKYSEWLSQGAPQNTLAQSGEKLFRELGCSGCHVNSSVVHAPPLAGLYGKMVPLRDGTFVAVDDKYIRDSILLPSSQIVAGYQGVMPTFQGRVSEEQLLELIAYIKSIGRESPSPNPQP
ncbi:MAG TPA: cytochrome c oxidase subunit II [Verrucomicrobiae bacterium]|nr:cytochrome c oxidase subunit II [Verrucomicrobiae bacterium]